MDGSLPNSNNPTVFTDSDIAVAYAELENYILSSSGGAPFGPLLSRALPGDVPLPPAQFYPLGDIPPVQNTPNIWNEQFRAYLQEESNAGPPYEELQIFEVTGQQAQQPPAPTQTTDSASSTVSAADRNSAPKRSQPEAVASGKRGSSGRGGSKKEKAPPVAPTPKATGKGSKAGAANRREPGASDNEIEVLGDDVKENAGLMKTNGLTDEEKVTVVEYITDELRWPTRKVKQATYFSELVKLFNSHVNQNQIANYWNNQAWAKYKA